MEFLSTAWWSALAAIVLIDLVLAGDNAIVIALAARRLPAQLRRRAIVWGSVGAIVVRSLMTFAAMALLRIPGLMLAGGLALLWIAWRLARGEDNGNETHDAATTFWGAIRTIVVADALMGIENVIGVAGAAHGAFDLVVIGLAVSVPIVVFGSALVLRLLQRLPWLVWVGAAVLALTALQMIAGDPLVQQWWSAG
jgi:YjbE family integral membrane protein